MRQAMCSPIQIEEKTIDEPSATRKVETYEEESLFDAPLMAGWNMVEA
jgi:hypothetical protein